MVRFHQTQKGIYEIETPKNTKKLKKSISFNLKAKPPVI